MVLKFNEDFTIEVFLKHEVGRIEQNVNPATGELFKTREELHNWLDEYLLASYGVILTKVRLEQDENIFTIKVDEPYQELRIECGTLFTKEAIPLSNTFGDNIFIIEEKENFINVYGEVITIDGISKVPYLLYEDSWVFRKE